MLLAKELKPRNELAASTMFVAHLTPEASQQIAIAMLLLGAAAIVVIVIAAKFIVKYLDRLDKQASPRSLAQCIALVVPGCWLVASKSFYFLFVVLHQYSLPGRSVYSIHHVLTLVATAAIAFGLGRQFHRFYSNRPIPTWIKWLLAVSWLLALGMFIFRI